VQATKLVALSTARHRRGLRLIAIQLSVLRGRRLRCPELIERGFERRRELVTRAGVPAVPEIDPGLRAFM
jgi:hypothetical protein